MSLFVPQLPVPPDANRSGSGRKKTAFGRQRGGSFWNRVLLTMAAFSALFPKAIGADRLKAGDREFFEAKIRPVLAQECYECHSTQGKRKGGLVLDHREALRRGGDSGAAILPGNPGGSRLLQAIRHSLPDLEMPKNGAKLEPAVIADFEKWIQMGAPDPRDHPPNAAELAQDKDWPAVRERRKLVELSSDPRGATTANAKRTQCPPHRPVHWGRVARTQSNAVRNGDPRSLNPSAQLQPARPAADSQRDQRFRQRLASRRV